MNKKTIKHLISQLKKGDICVREIPMEYRDLPEIIAAERRFGLRRVSRCGYDIISNRFFVEDEFLPNGNDDDWSKCVPEYFEDFESYSSYLDGNIYENACYYQLDPKRVPAGISPKKLFERNAFIDYTIDDFTLLPTEEEQTQFDEVEKRKPLIKKWINKFNECSSSEQLTKVFQGYKRSVLGDKVDLSFFIWNYIFEDVDNLERLQSVMEFVQDNGWFKSLCAVCNPDDVVKFYKCDRVSKQTQKKHINDLKQVAEKVKSNKYEYRRRGGFSSKTHYYCVEISAFEGSSSWPTFSYGRYFENVSDFVDYLGGDLAGCNLSKVLNADYDFSNCKTDETTRLPINQMEEYKRVVEKVYKEDKFVVKQIWINRIGVTVKETTHKFDYFCDFVYFLKGDLSNADLILCDGLVNVVPMEKIDLKDALVTSSVCDKWGITYDLFITEDLPETSFDYSERNENENVPSIQDSRELAVDEYKMHSLTDFNASDYVPLRVHYISDIHLTNLLANKKARSRDDVVGIVRKLISKIKKDWWIGPLLIDGDTSLNFELFELFVKELERCGRTVIFTLGNHETWSFPEDTIDELSEKYRNFLQSHGMFLLQNDVLYFEDLWEAPKHISENEINELPEEVLKNRVRNARLILFGGIGFSGYNPKFNAEYGLYQYNKTIGYSREIELKETKRFDNLYNKICVAFKGKNTVILTHMPLPDWHESTKQSLDYSLNDNSFSSYQDDNIPALSLYQPGFIYVSGHTHKNYYHDDGEFRIYADNQFGYNKNSPGAWPHLKYFEIDVAYDYFADYSDGIYEITPEEYRQFYRGKNIMMSFTREHEVLYMLKKNGYYCFICRLNNQQLYIMNGGQIKSLLFGDIDFYYDSMEAVIDLEKNPLNKFTSYQKSIAEEIKKIGGFGRIHGSIIDIDFFSHIYVNPYDNTITGYYALDMSRKIIYPTVRDLLEAKCPRLYSNYKKLIRGNNGNTLPGISKRKISPFVAEPIWYFDTEMYKASRRIKKMQKLYVNILTVWPEDLDVNFSLITGK